MSKRLTKIPGEKYLYKDEAGTYYLRIQEDGQDTNLSLKTKKITQAKPNIVRGLVVPILFWTPLNPVSEPGSARFAPFSPLPPEF
jgi:hypothetical protein